MERIGGTCGRGEEKGVKSGCWQLQLVERLRVASFWVMAACNTM
jgi:hypothetical protein